MSRLISGRVEIIFRLECSICRTVHEVPGGHCICFDTQTLMWPSIPDGWHVLDGLLVCSNHNIEVDGNVS